VRQCFPDLTRTCPLSAPLRQRFFVCAHTPRFCLAFPSPQHREGALFPSLLTFSERGPFCSFLSQSAPFPVTHALGQHVPYSDHSNYAELETFVGFVRPRRVVGIVRTKGPDYEPQRRFAHLLDTTTPPRPVAPPPASRISNVPVAWAALLRVPQGARSANSCMPCCAHLARGALLVRTHARGGTMPRDRLLPRRPRIPRSVLPFSRCQIVTLLGLAAFGTGVPDLSTMTLVPTRQNAAPIPATLRSHAMTQSLGQISKNTRRHQVSRLLNRACHLYRMVLPLLRSACQAITRMTTR